MDKAEQPVTQALKPCPNAEAIAQEIADRTRWKKNTDTYARIYQAAYAGAIAALNTRTTSLAAQDGLVEALESAEVILSQYADYLDGISYHELEMHPYIPSVQQARDDVRKALSAIKEQHHD